MTTAMKKPCFLYGHLSDVKESLSKSSERAKAQISGLAPRVRSKDGRRLLAQLEETIRRISDQIRFIGSPLSTNLLNDKPADYSAPAESQGRCAGWDIERRNVHALKNYLYDLASDLKLATEALPVERALIVKRLKDDTARYYASLQGELNRKGYARIDACAFMKALIADLRPSLEEEDYRITDQYAPSLLVSASEYELRDIFGVAITFVTNVLKKASVPQKSLHISLSGDGRRSFLLGLSYSGPAPSQQKIAAIVTEKDRPVFDDPLSVEYHYGLSRLSWRTKACSGSFELIRMNRSESRLTIKLPRRIPYKLGTDRWLTS